MNYITKEYLIQVENLNRRNIAEDVKNANRAAVYCHARLGDDYTKSEMRGVPGIGEEICPICGQRRDCFIFEKCLSNDGRKKIVKAKCNECEATFFAYQEGVEE